MISKERAEYRVEGQHNSERSFVQLKIYYDLGTFSVDHSGFRDIEDADVAKARSKAISIAINKAVDLLDGNDD